MEEKNNRPETPRGKLLVSRLLLALTILLFVSGTWLLLKQFVIMPRTAYVAPPTAPPAAVAATPAPTSAPVKTPEPTPEPTPYPLLPVRLYFPTMEQVCEIQPVGLTSDGAMDTIKSNVISAWYQYGPSPGDRGNAILNGHKSWQGELGVFSKLKDMQLGDQFITEMDDGSFLYWYVDSVDIYGRTEVPASVMEPRWGEEPELTLISCTGEWDALAGTSSQRSVVVGRLYAVIPAGNVSGE